MRRNEMKDAQEEGSLKALDCAYPFAGPIKSCIGSRNDRLPPFDNTVRLLCRTDARSIGEQGGDRDRSNVEPTEHVRLTSLETSVTSGDLGCDPRSVCTSIWEESVSHRRIPSTENRCCTLTEIAFLSFDLVVVDHLQEENRASESFEDVSLPECLEYFRWLRRGTYAFPVSETLRVGLAGGIKAKVVFDGGKAWRGLGIGPNAADNHRSLVLAELKVVVGRHAFPFAHSTASFGWLDEIHFDTAGRKVVSRRVRGLENTIALGGLCNDQLLL